MSNTGVDLDVGSFMIRLGDMNLRRDTGAGIRLIIIKISKRRLRKPKL